MEIQRVKNNKKSSFQKEQSWGLLLADIKTYYKATINKRVGDFPGGPVVKNLPANAGDRGLIPGPGKSHVPRGKKACAPHLLTLCFRAWEPQLLKPSWPDPTLRNKRSRCSEKPIPRN